MTVNWIIIGTVVVFAVVFVAYLIRKNQKDEKEVTNFFNNESSNFQNEESEFNDEK